MFYNGFNLFIDFIIAVSVFTYAYTHGTRNGYIQGYGEGQADYPKNKDHDNS